MTHIVRKRLLRDHVEHGALLVVVVGLGVEVSGVEDLERRVEERRVERELDVSVDAAVAPAAVHRHVRRQDGRRGVRPSKVVSYGKKLSN